MVTPRWLDAILYHHAALDLGHPDARAQLAEAIIDGLPSENMRATTRATIVYQSFRASNVRVTPDDLASAITHSITDVLKEE